MLSTEILNSPYINDILDLGELEQKIHMIEKKKYLEQHPYAIYEGKDGAWYSYVHEEGRYQNRRKVRRKTRKELEDYICSIYREAEVNPTLKEVFTEWQDRRLSIGRIKPSTYTRNEQIFLRHFSKFGERRIKSVTGEDICSFLEEQICEHELDSRAFSNLKSIVRGFLKRAKRLKYIDFNVDQVLSDVDTSDRLFKPKVVDDSKEIFYDDELEAVIEYCYDHRDDTCSLGVVLMLISGIRVGELVALENTDILEDAVRITKTETRFKRDGHYHYEVSSYPKTPAGVRTVIIPENFRWVLERLRLREGFIFVGKGGERLHTQAIYKRMKQICRKVGIAARSPHKARKTYGTILLDNSIDYKIIEKQMGHTDISCTELHYHRDRRRLEKKKEIFNSIPEFKGLLSKDTQMHSK